MRRWAERRQREFEELGATELARVFELVAKMCELEEDRERGTRPESRNFLANITEAPVRSC